MGSLTETVKLVSPRYRGWKRLLRGLTVDPDRLSPPIDAPGERDFIICGCPRSGTSLLAAALYQPPSIVTVMEPWDGMRMPPATLFASLRREIEETGWLRRGRLDVTSLIGEGAVRWGRDGNFPHRVDVATDYLLGVKWPAFWRYLDLLPDTRFLVCVRHPVAVIDSFRRTGGRLGEGLEYDISFHRTMNAELRAASREDALRRILLHDYIAKRLLPHLGRPNVLVVRYERWFNDRQSLLDEVARFLGVRLGPGHAVIDRPAGGTNIPERELGLIRERCTTAEALGYRLDGDPALAVEGSR